MHLQPFQPQDEALYCQMACDFHSGPASAATPCMDVFKRTFAHVLKATDAWGWLIIDNGEAAGYVLCSQMYSTEIGGYQVWIEDLSIGNAFQGRGLGTRVIQALIEQFKDACRIRLEITPENTGAAKLYERLGFRALPYRQMVLDSNSCCADEG